MLKLSETLDIRPFDNSVMGGRLKELFRGSGEFTSKLGAIEQMTCHTLLPDRIGGNHYHENKYEIIAHLFGNPITVYLKEPKTGEFHRADIEAGKKFDLIPEIAHALYCPSGEAHILEITNLKFDPENPKRDLFSYEVVTLKEAKQAVYQLSA